MLFHWTLAFSRSEIYYNYSLNWVSLQTACLSGSKCFVTQLSDNYK